MLDDINPADRISRQLVTAGRLGLRVPHTLRRAAVDTLEHRGCTVRPQAPADVLALGLLVFSLPAADLSAARAGL